MKKLMIYQKHFFLYVFILKKVIYPNTDDNSLLIAIFLASLPIIFIFLLHALCQKQNTKIDEDIFSVEAPFCSFSSVVYKLSE